MVVTTNPDKGNSGALAWVLIRRAQKGQQEKGREAKRKGRSARLQATSDDTSIYDPSVNHGQSLAEPRDLGAEWITPVPSDMSHLISYGN